MLSLVAQHMQLGGIEIAASRAVTDKRVVVPAVPQPVHDLRKLDGAVVALVMPEMRLAAEIVCFR